MKQTITLLSPRFLSFKNKGISKRGKGGFLKYWIFGTIGVLFWGGIFAVSFRVLNYFKSIEELGNILAIKLLSMILITLFSLLIFSSILTSLSKLYLSRDLSLVHSMPISSYKIFISRWIESTIDSSWMVLVYTLPVFISYGVVYAAGPLFYLSIAVALLILSIIASCISSIMVMLAVVFTPASRIRSLFIFLGLFLFLLLFLVFRLLRPERLVDPDAFVTLIIYMKNLRTPVSPYLPSTWAFDSMKAFLSGSIKNGLFHITLSGSFAVSMIFVNIILADAVYFSGVSKAHAAPIRLFKKPPSERNLLGFLPGPVRAFAIKEIKTFFRDQTQWSQIFLIGALIMIYIYNFKVLPLEKAPIKTIYLQNLLSFLNMGLAAFVLTSVAARFAYPAVSTEKEAFWLVKAAPIRLRSFLWIKFIIYFIPLLVLTEVLIAVTNILLQVTPFMMILSLTTVFFMVPGIVSMGIGFGAAYPDFKSENPAQTVTSFGGLLYMMLSAGYIGLVIIIEAGPVYNIFMAGVQGRALSVFEWVWVIGSFMLVFVLNVLAIVLPMVFGEKRLSVEMI
ncbi:MAG: hypothetical protein JRI61_05415 [Deltaproteobacteria bacterium]|nr:hypothetical protein [Deltaproteobacteria bacterium]